MKDPKALTHNLDDSETMKIVKRFAGSGDAAAVAGSIDRQKLQEAAEKRDPEIMKAILQQMLSTEEGKRLARKVKAAMENG